VIALVVTPVNTGAGGGTRKIIPPSYLTCIIPATSLQRVLAKIYIAVASSALALMEEEAKVN